MCPYDKTTSDTNYESSLVGLATVLQTFVHPGFSFPAMAARRQSSDLEEKAADSSTEEARV